MAFALASRAVREAVVINAGRAGRPNSRSTRQKGERLPALFLDTRAGAGG